MSAGAPPPPLGTGGRAAPSWLRTGAGLVAGVAATLVAAAVAFSAMRGLWPDYAAAEPDKAYSLAMLFARLAIGAAVTFAGAVAATWVAGDRGRTAWWLGGLYLAVSLRPHLVTVRDDYPVWYHFVYLGYLLPVAVAGARVLRARVPAREASRSYA